MSAHHLPPAGWGYSFMDHTGACYMAIAIGMALYHRRRTGEGQWVDLACIEAAGTLHGAATLDYTVNDRPARRDQMPNSNAGHGAAWHLGVQRRRRMGGHCRSRRR